MKKDRLEKVGQVICVVVLVDGNNRVCREALTPAVHFIQAVNCNILSCVCDCAGIISCNNEGHLTRCRGRATIEVLA